MNADGLGIIDRMIRPWIEKQVVFPEGDHGPCSKLLLQHLNIERKVQGDVAAFAVRSELTAEEIDPLVMGVCEAAQKDADDQAAGIQSYALTALYPRDMTFRPRKVFRRRPQVFPSSR